MKAAAKDLKRRYLAERRGLRKTGSYVALQCTAKIDRIVLNAPEVPLHELSRIPNFRAKRPKRLWRKLYAVLNRIMGTDSIREIAIESAPNARWLPRFRTTIVPQDPTGLRLEDLSYVLELIPEFKLVLVEVALDFPLASVVDTAFVRERLLCGKTRMRVGGTALHERWGSARSAKVVRAYVKFEASSFRIELQLNARFLRKHGINHASDFQKLATILPGNHIYFASLDNQKLREHLRRSSLPHKTKTEILRTVTTNQKSLWTTLRLLRRKWHFVNVRRLLRPDQEMNRIVLSALNKWAEQWQTHSSLRGMHKTKEQEAQ
jgi:hypothetical protein